MAQMNHKLENLNKDALAFIKQIYKRLLTQQTILG